MCACAGKKLSQMAKKMQKVFPQNFVVFGTSYSEMKPNCVYDSYSLIEQSHFLLNFIDCIIRVFVTL